MRSPIRWVLGFLAVTGTIVLVGVVAARRGAFPRRLAPGSEQTSLTPDERDERYRREFEEAQRRTRQYLTRWIDREEERGPIRCRLRSRPCLVGERETVEVSLVNEGGRVLRLWHSTFGLCFHVTLLLRQPDGRVVAHLAWAPLSSPGIYIDPESHRPTGDLPVRVLEPGEADRHPINPRVVLLGDSAAGVGPGPYYLQAVFRYSDLGGYPEPNRDLFARSELLPVVVEEGPEGFRVVPE